jgi:hypothetical protein
MGMGGQRSRSASDRLDDRRLCADVLEAFVVELSRSLKRRAKQVLGLASVDDALTGAVSVIQRGDSALRPQRPFHRR